MSQLSLDIERIKKMYSTILQYAARTGIPVPQVRKNIWNRTLTNNLIFIQLRAKCHFSHWLYIVALKQFDGCTRFSDLYLKCVPGDVAQCGRRRRKAFLKSVNHQFL